MSFIYNSLIRYNGYYWSYKDTAPFILNNIQYQGVVVLDGISNLFRIVQQNINNNFYHSITLNDTQYLTVIPYNANLPADVKKLTNGTPFITTTNNQYYIQFLANINDTTELNLLTDTLSYLAHNGFITCLNLNLTTGAPVIFTFDTVTESNIIDATDAITALTGDVTAVGPGIVAATLSNAAVINQQLSGFQPTAGTITQDDSILSAIEKLAADTAVIALPNQVIYYTNSGLAGNSIMTFTNTINVNANIIGAVSIGNSQTPLNYVFTNNLSISGLNGIMRATYGTVGTSLIYNSDIGQPISNANLAGAPTTAATPNTLVLRDNSGNFQGNATNITGIVSLLNGGTGAAYNSNAALFNAISPFTSAGDILYGTGPNTSAILSGSSTRKFLTESAYTPAWSSIMLSDIPAGTSAQILMSNTTPTWTTISGDLTLSTSGIATLSAVNTNIGSFGGLYMISFTVNNKGLITAASNGLMASTGNLNAPASIIGADSSGNFTANLITGDLIGNVSGTASNITGLLSIANGGTGQITAQSAINALSNIGASTAGQYLRSDATNATFANIQVADVPILNQNTTGTAQYANQILFAASVNTPYLLGLTTATGYNSSYVDSALTYQNGVLTTNNYVSANGTVNSLAFGNSSGMYFDVATLYLAVNNVEYFQLNSSNLTLAVTLSAQNIAPISSGYDLGTSINLWNHVYANNFVGTASNTIAANISSTLAGTYYLTMVSAAANSETIYTNPAIMADLTNATLSLPYLSGGPNLIWNGYSTSGIGFSATNSTISFYTNGDMMDISTNGIMIYGNLTPSTTGLNIGSALTPFGTIYGAVSSIDVTVASGTYYFCLLNATSGALTAYSSSGASFNTATGTLTTTNINAAPYYTLVSNSASYYFNLITGSASANYTPYTAAGISFNPSTNILTTTSINANIHVTNTSSSTNYYLPLITATSSAYYGLLAGGSMTYNPSTNLLTTTCTNANQVQMNTPSSGSYYVVLSGTVNPAQSSLYNQSGFVWISTSNTLQLNAAMTIQTTGGHSLILGSNSTPIVSISGSGLMPSTTNTYSLGNTTYMYTQLFLNPGTSASSPSLSISTDGETGIYEYIDTFSNIHIGLSVENLSVIDYSNGITTFVSSIMPSADNTYTAGSSTAAYSYVYAYNIISPSSLNINTTGAGQNIILTSDTAGSVNLYSGASAILTTSTTQITAYQSIIPNATNSYTLVRQVLFLVIFTRRI